ncbi:MAG: hypothetical protein ACI97B_003456 [Verrucomicrobiales bacterium]|jgi:hypothetical protein
MIEADAVLELAKKLSAKNVGEIKKKLLALAG